ncbi:MAG: hypothetical protein HFACDABA_01593 [Anaerolineales bacterium]|nr:hypothetical protein [Anaerolineales bacterium]
MTALHKLSLLLSIGIRNPVEFLDRLEAILTVNLEKLVGRKSVLPFTPSDEVDKRTESILGRRFKNRKKNRLWVWQFFSEYQSHPPPISGPD